MKIISLEEHYRTHAIEMDVPTWPSNAVLDDYYSGFDPLSAFSATTGWQRHVCEELKGVFI